MSENTQVAKPDLVTCTIDGHEVSVPKGTLVIRAAEKLGIAIPRFCDHPLLEPAGACRQCLVEVPDMGNGRGMPKPQASCTLTVMPGMQVETQVTSDAAKKAQEGILELLLINHPLDCPICDKGGECPLQNQAMANGPGGSRYEGVKRTYPKPVSVSAQILLDRERCVLCARCTRFSEQISGDPFIALVERGALQQVGRYEDEPYDSYFSGNVIQICPVGALTSADYRFQSRPFDLVSTTTTCENCSSGCEIRADHRHYQVKRRLAGDKPEVNEEWICDKGRFGFRYGRENRLKTPLVRQGGELVPTSWHEAIDAAVAGLVGAKAGVIAGGRHTLETAYAYSRFARTVLGTNNVDYRPRAGSAEEAEYVASRVAGKTLEDSVHFQDLEAAKRVVLVAFEPEDEAPSVFLRLRKGVRKRGLKVTTVAPFESRGSNKLSAEVITTTSGREVAAVRDLELDADTIVMVGERAQAVPGLLSAIAAVCDESDARSVWIPKGSAAIGSIETGLMPGLLPGGRAVSDPEARAEVAAAWRVPELPSEPGLATAEILAAAGKRELDALILSQFDFDQLPASAVEAVENAKFVVAFDYCDSEATQRADVVFPIALLEEQAGTLLNWEHRHGAVNLIIDKNTAPMTELRILAALADALGKDLGVRTPDEAYADWQRLGTKASAAAAPAVRAGRAVKGIKVACWAQLLDKDRVTVGADDLLKTSRKHVARISPKSAAKLGLADAQTVTIAAELGSVELPLELTPEMAPDTVWLPQSYVYSSLQTTPGAVVTCTAGGMA